MGGASEWRKLAVQFRKLGDTDRDLRAFWDSAANGGSGQWSLHGSVELAIESFTSLAERAAALLGQLIGRSALRFWLDTLKQRSPRYEPEVHESRREDNTVAAEVGKITSPCQASAECCYKLETEAIAKEAGERRLIRRRDPLLALLDSLPTQSPVSPMVPATRSLSSQVPPPRGPTPVETIGAQIERLRLECRLTVEELAEVLGVEVRSVYRHRSGQSTPRPGHLAAYERLFSQRLERKVVLSLMSGKRQ